MDKYVSRKEFDEFVEVVNKALLDCAAAADATREILVKAATLTGGFKKLYCRKCKKTFAYRELEKVSGLTIPCPKCGDGLVPVQNIDLDKLENDK